MGHGRGMAGAWQGHGRGMAGALKNILTPN